MKKVIGAHYVGFVDGDKSIQPRWQEQREIEMGPLEEAMILADWAVGEHDAKMPMPMTIEQKVDLLLAGEEILAQARAKSYELEMQQWRQERAVLEIERVATADAYNETIINLPKGTLTC